MSAVDELVVFVSIRSRTLLTWLGICFEGKLADYVKVDVLTSFKKQIELLFLHKEITTSMFFILYATSVSLLAGVDPREYTRTLD